MTDRSRLIAGCMSGTSCDAVDAAIVRVNGRGLAIAASLEGFASVPLGETGRRLLAFSHGEPLPAAEVVSLVASLTRAHEQSIAAALRDAGAGDADLSLIAAHGQTLHHAPPRSWQALAPSALARRFGVPVVSDLRAADLAAGGQGAPITPLADAVLFGKHAPLAVVNLGGFCNVTLLPGVGLNLIDDAGSGVSGVRGFDVCPCNQLLDAAARRFLGRDFDEGGLRAASGRVDEPQRDAIASRLSVGGAGGAGRSLGSDDECLELLEALVPLDPEAALATLADAIGAIIAASLGDVATVALAGGGTRNRALVGAIRRRRGGDRLAMSDELGVPATAREAMATAVLGSLSLDGVAATLPSVTGVTPPAPVAGAWALPPDGSWRPTKAENPDP